VLFWRLRSAALGTRHLTRTSGSHLILLGGTPANMQELRATDVQLLKGGESKDVQEVFPVAVRHPGSTLGFNHAYRSDELGEVVDRRTWVVFIEPTKSPRCGRNINL
jgi:hypothetical protein